MKNKITLLFAALMMTLGVSAQVERPAGYFPFPTEVISKTEITSEAELAALMQETDPMNRRIVIQHNHGLAEHNHDGMYMSIESKMNGNVHKITVHELCSGLSIFTLDGDAANGYTLATVHEGNYIGELGGYGYYNTNSTAHNYKFEYVEGKGFYITSDYKSTTRCLCATTEDGTVKLYGEPASYYPKDGNHEMFFKVYKVNETKGTTDYVQDARVKLIGPGGNVFETLHSGWSDFYEFIENANDTQAGENYAVELTNVKYHKESNEITGSIKFPFPVTGRIAQIPVHLNPSKNVNLRVSTNESEDGYEFVTVGNEGVFANKRNQWYIRPVLDGSIIKYSIQSATNGGKYIYTPQNSLDVTLSDEPTYFKLEGQTSNGKLVALRFTSLYTNPSTNHTTKSYLYNKNQTLSTITNRSYDVNFLVTRVSGEEAGGYDAIGFTRTYHSDTYFWDGGEIAMDDAPADLKAVFEHEDHEGYDTEGSEHRIYTANTGIYVPKLGDVTVTFKYLDGTDRLTILGVDIVNALGEIVSSEYHLGYAGVDVADNVYVVKDVPVGNYFLRYWVCNRTDWENKKNHNLGRNSGKIIVTGADYYLTYSDAPTNGAFSSNTTWYRMRLSDGLEKYISAQPNYVDADNNLMLTNDTPPNDYAGLWAIVGDAENGYKFYNRAWGPEYAMTTVGENGKARTYMVRAAEASTYDIVQRDRSQKDYKFYVKLHGTANNYLQNFGGYNGTGHLSTWNSESALGDAASVMTFETVNEEGFANRTETVKNTLAEKWTPWTAEPEVADIIDDFAQLMLNRNSFALLNGKVFKFANADDEAPRKDMLLTVNGEGKGAGVDPTNTATDYMQFIDNGDGTFKLFHIATAKYLGVPDGAVTTTKSSEAAAYIYTFQDAAQKEQLTFETENQTLHLNNTDLTLMNLKEADVASRWTVFYGETDAQELGAVAIEAQEMLEEITSADYLAKAGQQGYASPAQIEAYQNAIQGLSGKSVEEATNALNAAMKAIEDAEKNIRYLTSLEQLSNTRIYGIHCERGPLAYVAENSTTHLSTPKLNSADDITANVVANANEQFAILRTENTPEGWYYLYNITTQKFVNQNFELIENPVCAVNFRDISDKDANYRWEVWFGEISNGDAKLNVNQNEGLALNSVWEMDKGNKFRIEYAETNETKTAPALEAIIALETAKAKAEATAFLNDTPKTVGYPVAAERTTFANAIVAATSVADVVAAKTAFKETTNVVMPEDGKAYVIRNVQKNGTKYMLSSVYTNAYLPAATENAKDDVANIFVCRVVEGGYVLVNAQHGKYMLFHGMKTNNPFSTDGFDANYSDKNILKLNSQAANLPGTFSIAGQRNRPNDGYNGFATMTIATDGNMNANAGENEATYSDSYSSLFTFEEVDYTLNKVTLTAISESDKLINGLVGAIGTFSAPYATVIPEGVTAYYAKATSTNAENSSAILEEVVEDAIPAGEGVILVGGAADDVVMLPATSESQETLENNYLIGTGATPVAMQTGDFILARGDQGIGFYQATGTLKAGKAYIQFGGAVKSLVLRFGGNTTDIDAVTTVTPSNDELIYDIYGRRVTEVKKGNIYIKNGKKFIVK